jgi:hypothetical protein
MKRALLPLIGWLLSTAVFAADAPQPYGVFPRPTTQPTFKVYSSGLSPFTVIHNTGPRTLLFQDLDKQGLSGPSHVAYVADHKVRIAPTNAPIDPANMTESWMLFLFHSSKGWPDIKGTPYVLDIPVFVVLQKMPSEIKPAGSGLEFTFPSESGYIALMPFFGTSFIRATQTAAWKDTLPQDIFLRCRLLAEISREYPIKVEETFKLFPTQDKVLIRDRFDFLSIDDDWKTGHKKIAPLEYTVALAQRYKFRLLSVTGQVTDLDTAVGPGAWAGVEGDECSYTLTGLLRYINTVEQPKVIPPDHPLLAEARKNFDWAMPAMNPDAPLNYIARARALAAHFPYADAPTQQSLRAGFRLACDSLASLFPDGSQRPPGLLFFRNPETMYRPLHDMAAAAYDLSLIQAGWPRARESYRPESQSADRVDAVVAFARMACWLGDDDSYRLASYRAAKQFLALWTTGAAYPKWIREKNLWNWVNGNGLQLRDDNGAITMTYTANQVTQDISLEDMMLPYSRGAPIRLLCFERPDDPSLRFMKDRMPEQAKYAIDACARKYAPDFHKAAYVDQSRLPQNPPPLSPREVLPLRLDDWDFYFDIPLAQRPARHEKFWQNNGGIKGHEFDIILAGIERKYLSLWQGSTPPQPDATFRPGYTAQPHQESDEARLIDLGLVPPQTPRDHPGDTLHLCIVRGQPRP